MKVCNVEFTKPYNNAILNKNVSFKGRLHEDKVVQKILNSANESKAMESFTEKVVNFFKRNFYSSKTIEGYDSEGNKLLKLPKRAKKQDTYGNPLVRDIYEGNIYVVNKDASGIPDAIAKESYSKGFLSKVQFWYRNKYEREYTCYKDGSITRAYFDKNGKETERITQGKSGEMLEYVKNGEVIKHIEKGFIYSNIDGLNCRIALPNGKKYYFNRESMSLIQRLKAEESLSLKNILKCLFADSYNYEKAPVICRREYVENTQRHADEVLLSPKTTFEDLLNMYRQGRLDEPFS